MNVASSATYAFGKAKDGTYMILCGERSGSDAKHHGGLYDVPVGMVEKGETPLDAAVRETKEETGISIPSNLMRFIETQPWGDGIHEGANFIAVLPTTPPIKAHDNEHSTVRWMPLEEVDEHRWAFGMNNYIRKYYTQQVMSKRQIVRLNESAIRRMVTNAVKRTLMEMSKYDNGMGGFNSTAYDYDEALKNATDIEDFDRRMKDRQELIDMRAKLAANNHPSAVRRHYDGSYDTNVSTYGYIHPELFMTTPDKALKDMESSAEFTKRQYGFPY